MVSAALQSEILLNVCRCMRSCCPGATLLLCSWNSPQFPPECPFSQKRGAVIQAQNVLYLEQHCLQLPLFQEVNFHAFRLLPVFFFFSAGDGPASTVQLWATSSGATQRQSSLQRKSQSPLRNANYELDVLDAGGALSHNQNCYTTHKLVFVQTSL